MLHWHWQQGLGVWRRNHRLFVTWEAGDWLCHWVFMSILNKKNKAKMLSRTLCKSLSFGVDKYVDQSQDVESYSLKVGTAGYLSQSQLCQSASQDVEWIWLERGWIHPTLEHSRQLLPQTQHRPVDSPYLEWCGMSLHLNPLELAVVAPDSGGLVVGCKMSPSNQVSVWSSVFLHIWHNFAQFLHNFAHFAQFCTIFAQFCTFGTTLHMQDVSVQPSFSLILGLAPRCAPRQVTTLV